MQWTVGFFNKKNILCSDCEQKAAIREGSVRLREWNSSCSN
jgi:hypothetical protein